MADGLSTLRSLTQTAIDSAEGYERASENAKSPQLKQTLSEAASKRRRLVADLNRELVRLGGEAQDRGSTAGAAHHVWVQITNAFKDSDESATERVEEGEDYIEKKFREALNNSDLQPQTREVLQRAHGEISEGERLADRLAAQYEK